jgi:hypothetical protein
MKNKEKSRRVCSIEESFAVEKDIERDTFFYLFGYTFHEKA